MFEKQIEAYEMLRKEHMQRVTSRMNRDDLKEYNEVLIAYKHPDAQAGEYTDTDMAAGDTLFGDHEQLIARVPQLLRSTQSALDADQIHPMIIAGRFHGFYEYLHPFRDGNGRLGRLFANYILHLKGHPIVIIPQETKGTYIDALRCIRTEGTDEYLIDFFFQMAIQRMQREIDEKKRQNLFKPFLF